LKTKNTVIWLSVLILVLALFAAAVGLFWQDGGAPSTFTTLRGETVEIYGRGLYRHDTVFTAAGFKGQDAVTLFLAVPLLALTTVLYRRGSLRGSLLLLGVLTWFLYAYASMALGAAYNRFFLVYVVLFSASFFAFVTVFGSIQLGALPPKTLGQLPSRGPGALLLASGLVTLFVWGSPLVEALLQNRPVELLASYTTMVTYALDLALITPTCFLAGALILRRDPLGYRIAFPLLGLIVVFIFVIPAMTAFQVQAGVSFTLPEIIGPIAGFVVLGLFAVWVMVTILRRIPDSLPVVRRASRRTRPR
jgi:hypothetical protein